MPVRQPSRPRLATCLHPAAGGLQRLIAILRRVTSATPNTVIDRFLDGVRTGRIYPDLYADDARLDATVPGWRFQAQGPAQIAGEYGTWFCGPSELETVERLPVDGGEVVRYLGTFDLAGEPHAVHHVHLIKVCDDRITSDTVFCGGRWGPEVLAEMGPAAHAG